jgi:TonB-dependent SusC/RagA subfamily outer membrane receptor
MRFLALAMIVCFSISANAQTPATGKFETAPRHNKDAFAGKSKDSTSGKFVLKLRCPGTQLASSPLIILDDCVYEGDLNSIDVNSIESITVLKDNSAAAIWGAKAASGVIIIKTKKKKPESVPIT